MQSGLQNGCDDLPLCGKICMLAGVTAKAPVIKLQSMALSGLGNQVLFVVVAHSAPSLGPQSR